MVDEAAFRAARNASTSPPCVFAKAVLAGCATCATSVRRALAERETIGCTSPVARTNCETFAALLRERAAFALKLTAGAPLPHAAKAVGKMPRPHSRDSNNSRPPHNSSNPLSRRRARRASKDGATASNEESRYCRWATAETTGGKEEYESLEYGPRGKGFAAEHGPGALDGAGCLLRFRAGARRRGGPPPMSAVQLDQLVGPIALYPDDLVAIILPAATYPIAARRSALRTIGAARCLATQR